MHQQKTEDEKQKGRRTPTVSARLPDGGIVELIYDPKAKATRLALWRDDEVQLLDEIETAGGEVLVPFAATNNLVRHEIVLLPAGIEEYGSTASLIGQIQAYLHRYVDLTPNFERLASYYVLLTWVYDAFNELPYLRFRGDFGSGKTRALLTLGALCHKAFFASGASTVSPIFHTLDTFGGTLIFDEADFRFSDEKAELTKIFNNGNVRGFPVLRTAITIRKEFDPRAFFVYGPKVVAMRSHFDDRALESRFLTEGMGARRVREDIPINLPDEQREEARRLRNRLLLYRFRNLNTTRIDPTLASSEVEARLNQIGIPLLSIVEDAAVREEVRSLIAHLQGDLMAERGDSIAAHVLATIASLMQPETTSLSIAEIASAFNLNHASQYERLITNRKIGTVLRRALQLHVYRSHGNYRVALANRESLDVLFGKYGLTPPHASPR